MERKRKSRVGRFTATRLPHEEKLKGSREVTCRENKECSCLNDSTKSRADMGGPLAKARVRIGGLGMALRLGMQLLSVPGS